MSNGHDDDDDRPDNNDNNDLPGSSESALDDLFVEGARFREPSAAERAAWAKEQRKQVNKSKRRRKRERPAGAPGESAPRSGSRAVIAIVVLFALTFVVFYVFNPGGGGSSTSNNNATLLAGEPREISVNYAVPKGGTGDPGAIKAIRDDIAQTQAWFASQTGGKTLRIKETGGLVDVQQRELPATAAELETSGDASNIVQTVIPPNPQEIVLTYVDVNHKTDCGAGGLRWADVYMGSCSWRSGGSKVAARESIHALGAVDQCAPHFAAGSNVTEPANDIMYNGPQAATNDVQLDPGHDDYYMHHIQNCIDIARHPAWTSD